jgi:hypothetical protein
MSAGDRPVRALLSAEVFRHLRQRLRLRVGALGRFWFRPGVYLYVGSAQRNLRARTERHGRKNKPLRWDIDHLSEKAHDRGMGIVAMKVVGGGVLGARSGYVVPGFDKDRLKLLPGAAIRHVLQDKRIHLLAIGMRLKQEIDANIETICGDITYTTADRALLAEFSAEALDSAAMRKMVVK